MTPQDFIAKWRNVELKERSASQSHFNDLCRLLGVLDPIAADPAGDWFTFERGATKTGGGEGWADVWRRGCFAWEYKGPRKDLDRAFAQLLQYAVALENPPLLIVSDTNRIRIHTNWTNTVQEVHEFTTDELIDGAKRAALRRAFTDPDWFKPAKTRQALTEETAREFAGLAQRLRERGHEAHEVAHFINRLVFCMFAEDAGLLPDDLFTRMLERSRRRPDSFVANARLIFGAMATGGAVGFEDVDWFNGGLFEDDRVLPVDADDIEQLLQAARRDWSQIDPAILGTLFERGLDPAKRSQLGAHYTDRAKIEMIVEPVIVRPLAAEWAGALARMAALVEAAPRRTAERLLSPAERRRRDKAFAAAGAIHAGFVDRLAAFRVLDPACGSGNFLYVALRALKDLEHRANLDAEALGLPRGFPRVGPECVLGIELNPYAAELARVSVWIGEIQWMRRNGFDAAKNPILRPLDTIECRDAVLGPDGTRAAWPAADAVVGNPPFLGNKKMIGELGEEYTRALRKAWPEVPGGVDLVCYWFAKAWGQMVAGQLTRAGLVATNSIRGGANREVLKPIVEGGRIFEARSDDPWTVEGAAVRVSLVCFEFSQVRGGLLDGRRAARIDQNLSESASEHSIVATLNSNVGWASNGISKKGSFDIDGALAREWLQRSGNPNQESNLSVLRPWHNGLHVTRRSDDKWIIDFRELAQDEASYFEQPFEYVKAVVKKEREQSRANGEREKWWLLARRAPKLRSKLVSLQRYIATPEVAKHRVFKWLPTEIVPDKNLVVVPRDDDTSFGILHSRFHELWSLRMGTSLEDRPRYTPSTTFETFPFPEGLTPDIPAADYADDPRTQAIALAAQRLDALREAWLNPPDLVVRTPEVVPGYPDRLLPVDAAAAAVLRTRTLTNLYNARPAWLANAHAALDQAVADAYGWGAEQRAGTLTDDAVLARLFALNQARAGQQGTNGEA